jgi:hypothetical protein
VTGPLAQMPYGVALGDELEPVAEQTLLQAVTEGRTLFSSAGDTGSSCPVLILPVVGGATESPTRLSRFGTIPAQATTRCVSAERSCGPTEAPRHSAP